MTRESKLQRRCLDTRFLEEIHQPASRPFPGQATVLENLERALQEQVVDGFSLLITHGTLSAAAKQHRPDEKVTLVRCPRFPELRRAKDGRQTAHCMPSSRSIHLRTPNARRICQWKPSWSEYAQATVSAPVTSRIQA
jgi:hypothetical protein